MAAEFSRHQGHIALDDLVQLIHPDVVAGASGPALAVVGAAGIGRLQVPAAHGEHGSAAVPALQKAGIDIVVDLGATVVGTGPLLPQGPGHREGAVVDNGLMVVFNDDLLHLVPAYVLAVDFGPGVLPLTESTDVKIVVQNPLDCDNGPCTDCP